MRQLAAQDGIASFGRRAGALVAALALLAVACGDKGGGPAQNNLPDAGVDVGEDATEIDFGPAPSEAEVFELLPIEVLGPPGTAASTTVSLSESAIAADDVELHLRVSNVVEPDTATLWVNEEHPYQLSAADGPFVRPTGGWADGIVELDPAHLVSGQNTFTFEYTRQVDDAVGFRVLSVHVIAGGETAVGPTEWVDPESWEPFTREPEALARGQSFFQEVTRDDGPVCATCHTFSGADLEYYAFSNRAIVARAMFHEFSRTEGEDIASYIRSLNIAREGRPWVAPFQPGPDNVAAAGAGVEAIVKDDAVLAAYTQGEIPTELSWNHAADTEPYFVASSVQAPTWSKWLPREVNRDWFERRGGALQSAFRDLEVDGSLENAHAFMAAAVAVGEELAAQGAHSARVDLLRLAAVQLWDWSRRQGFYEPHHGFPNDEYGDEGLWGSPSYPYEVGVAFFEAADEGDASQIRSALGWWITQMSADYGRGRSNGVRPLNYRDVIVAARPFVGPSELTWIYLLGSWEESRGPLEESWGEASGPVRLLEVALPHTSVEWLPVLWDRHLRREAAYSQSGGRFTPEHAELLGKAWAATCADLEDNSREQLVARTPDELRDALICP